MTDAATPTETVQVVPTGQVAFGMQLPIQSQSRLYVAKWETRSGPPELARVAQAAEAAGFFYVGVCDHTAIPERLAGSMGTTWYDTTATLGWLAGLTSRVRLLSHVLVLAQRHPLRAAKELSTLDLLSGGRLVVGVGAGHVPEEYDLLTGDFAERGRHTDEAVAALALAFTEEFPTLPGPRWPASGMGVAPRPVQQPRPPIWIGGSSKAAIRRTAALGDGWLPQGTPRKDLPGQIAELRRLREELRGGAALDIGTIAEPIYLTGDGTGGDPGWELPPFVLQGGPEPVAESLRELVAMGVNHLQVRFMARSVEELCDQTLAFGELVGPRLNG
ncbi:MAG TPA: TIGR03619 family F420-dependent LLM class oxidoreductase [Acidimicrobiales bacterium]|jgi:probable F420-dependent oxidoreductase|nr:TIGR03619 family F420-dependent LLM class oxidoreductase [Acidimicrobiales bacterium]